MIKIISKYYTKFPPIMRNAIDISLTGIMNCIGVDYFQPSAENILLGCDEVTNKLFV